ncbi:MAG TPA: hypothetical protein PKE14_05855, partial [Chitinophagales bacterium]|nr:hypothetical protein [Chitinophagales bacterium]
CLFVMALGYGLIVFFGKNAGILYTCMAICGIGWAAIVSLPFAIMSEKVNKQRMGLFMGIFNMSIVIPQLIVSLLIAQFVDDAEDKKMIFEISAITLFISALIWRSVREKRANASSVK